MARLILAFIAGLTISHGFSKPMSDERKWAAIERNREARRAVEREYEACTAQCLRGCVKRTNEVRK